MHHEFNNKFIKAIWTWPNFKNNKKNYFFSFLISMIMNLYVKYTSDIKRNKCKKKNVLALKLINLTHKVMIHFTGVDLL